MIKTAIQWAEYTHNFWTGCHKVSEGCKYCYLHRMYDNKSRDANAVYRARDQEFYKPFYDKDPKLIFTCSMSDFFIQEADQWRGRAWATIKNTPWHTWQILTKRPERIADCLPPDWGEGYPNVWLGVSVENQKNIHRMGTLAAVPAALRFVSAEPLLGEIDFLKMNEDGVRLINPFSWVILGGESGNDSGKYRYRPCEVAWMEKIVHNLKEKTGVRVFVKQMGTYLAKKGIGAQVRQNGWVTDWHGADFDRFPVSLQLREMPEREERVLAQV